MKKLSDFKDEQGIQIACQVFDVIADILSKKENAELKDEKNPLKMFSAFMRNSPAEMMKIFAILSEKEPNEYHIDGAEAMTNMLMLAGDPIVVGLFISQSQMKAVKSSGSASQSTEAQKM